MKAVNNLTTPSKAPKFTDFIQSDKIQALITRATSSKLSAARMTANILDMYGASEQLRNCDQFSIITAALRAEAMSLDLALGQAAVVPYGTSARFQITAKGYKQLAVRSMAFADIDCFPVYDGEYKGRDPLTRRPVFEWIEDDDEREQLPIIGYYAYYRLTPDFGNLFRSIYWSHDRLLRHADRYSKAFSYEKYQKMLSGEMSDSDMNRMKNSSPWNDTPDSLGHQAMCMKTMYLRLLNDGFAPLSTELRTALHQGMAEEKDEEFIPASGGIVDIPSYESVNEPVSDFSSEVYTDTANTAKAAQSESNAATKASAKVTKAVEVETNDDDPFGFGGDE